MNLCNMVRNVQFSSISEEDELQFYQQTPQQHQQQLHQQRSSSSSTDISKKQQSQQQQQQQESSVRIPFQSLALTTATCQISALVFCLSWSIRFNFYESTATHCRVPNYLPSLSATLDFTPQKDVWRACIGLTGAPRYFISYLYYRIYFKSRFLLALHWLEVTALIGLSIVDSIKYFTFHATCVGIFLSTSVIHMMIVCCNYVPPNSSLLRAKLDKTKTIKKRIAIINSIAIVVALYLYDRHQRYCEPGVYSMFSFLEYIVITANVIYHLQAFYDLSEYSIEFTKSSEFISYNEESRIFPKYVGGPNIKKKLS